MKNQFQTMVEWEKKMAYLQSDISATMHWSYKYGMLVSEKIYEEIKEEETEYVNAHNKQIDEEEK